jgi:hypothetical protein
MLVPIIAAAIAAATAYILVQSQTNPLPQGLVYVTVGDRAYAVRDVTGMQERAEFLSLMYARNMILLDYLAENHPSDERTVRLLASSPEIREVESSAPQAGYTDNKGDAIALCLKDGDYDQAQKAEALYFVMLHELAHVATVEEQHPPIFWENFNWIQEQAIRAGVYTYVNYEDAPVDICGLNLNENPCTTQCENAL